MSRYLDGQNNYVRSPALILRHARIWKEKLGSHQEREVFGQQLISRVIPLGSTVCGKTDLWFMRDKLSQTPEYAPTGESSLEP